MILDGHIHIGDTAAKQAPFLDRLHQAGIDGGAVFSAFPDSFISDAKPYEERLDHVLEVCFGQKLLFPFFFINPTADNACEQVERAVKSGIAGFKVICTTFYPSDPRCMETCRHIAFHGKPVVFHSGILWDGINPSGRYNRPIEFEPLFGISSLRFALAHISWPWCDECIAVYGKLDSAVKRSGASGGMRLDNTPGTPKVYREDTLKKVLMSGYDVLGKLYFGTDNFVEDYNVAWARDWIAFDREIYEKLGLNRDQIERIFSRNLLDFITEEPQGEALWESSEQNK